MTSFLRVGPARPVAIWLFVVAAMVFAMVVVGGSTRLTNSGLSITEWKPLSGTIPPLNPAQWQAEFEHYKQIPQYRIMNQGMSLEGFRFIYWWEWSHRLLGRLVGVAFAVPFLAFLWRRMIPARLIWRCVVLFALGGLQGVIGWWMVYSGLADRTEVAPERLTAHLGLALVLFCLLIWTGLEAWAGPRRPIERKGWPGAAMALLALVFLQILLGGLVAGNRAGLIYNDWPFFAGRLWPSDYVAGDLRQTLLHSLAAVQANHRVMAYGLFLLAWVTALRALRSRYLPRDLGGLALILAVLVTVQAALGIGTLMMQVPLGMALAHQLTAAVFLAITVGFAWRTRRA
ncbi:MAG: COX15/CtaA family protein [Caulobacteraceae bacterium]